MNPTVPALKPGHDAALALISDGELVCSHEAGKASGRRNAHHRAGEAVDG